MKKPWRTRRVSFPAYFDAQLRLRVDGSLSFVIDFESDSTLAGAKGPGHAKKGRVFLLEAARRLRNTSRRGAIVLDRRASERGARVGTGNNTQSQANHAE